MVDLVSRSPLDLGVVGGVQEVVPDGRHVRERLEHDVAVVVGLDVVEADDAGEVEGAVVGAHLLAARLQVLDHLSIRISSMNTKQASGKEVNRDHRPST